MEETTTSWKNHSFTLLVFGGIVVLCSIFFVLGMLVGRTQGQKIAETAFAEKEKSKPVAVASADDLPNYYSPASDENDGLKPAREAPQPATPPASREPASSSSSDRSASAGQKSQATNKGGASAKNPTAKQPPKSPATPSADRYLQVLSTKDQKQANAELKKVKSKGFDKALINIVILNGQRWHRVVVGPYKESELGIATSDLKAKGYKQVVPR